MVGNAILHQKHKRRDENEDEKCLLKVQHVSQAYGQKDILSGVSFQLKKGEIGCILGPSGSGKTTILRTIAGFENIKSGEIYIHSKLVSSSKKTVRPEKRSVGVVFQDYALFPHLTIRQNIEIGLRDLSAKEKKQRTDKWLERINLTKIDSHYPYQVSGGEAQRIALARALAPQPDLILLDEPFSNLDIELKETLEEEVRKILKENQITALLVTHDQNEAFAVADSIGVFYQGKIVQWGSPYELYHEPENRFIADFIGQGVFMKGTLTKDGVIQTELGELKADHKPTQIGTEKVEVLLRPDDIVHDDDSPLQAEVLHKAFRGAYILYTLVLPGGQKLLSYVHSHHNHDLGSMIGIRLEADHVVYFEIDPLRPGT